MTYATFLEAITATHEEIHSAPGASPINGFTIREIFEGQDTYSLYRVQGECWTFHVQFNGKTWEVIERL